jgi:hypothetical protein
MPETLHMAELPVVVANRGGSHSVVTSCSSTNAFMDLSWFSKYCIPSILYKKIRYLSLKILIPFFLNILGKI